jgi:glutamate carboxypeptidase
MRELLQHFQRERKAMLEALREIVIRESPSFDKAAVDALGAVLAARFAAVGGRVTPHPAADFGDHLQIDFAGGAGKPVMLLGHFDTVWSLGTLAKMPFRIARGRAWGPGTLDMKCGIVMMLFAIDALQRRFGGLPRPVTVLLNTDEEVGSASSRKLTERLAKRCEAVLVLEPAQNPGSAVKTARKGVGDYTVRITGLASHAGVDFEKGHNAILEAARQALAISDFTDLKRGITVNPGVIAGGTRTNVVPDFAELRVDVRVARARDEARLDREFRRLRPRDKHCRLEVSGGLNRPPMERSPGVVRLLRQAQSLGRQIGWKVEEAATGGGSDGNFTAALGLPTLDGLGAAGEGAHAVHESVLLDEIPRRTALVAALLATL